MDNVQIPQDDQERIDALVRTYRHALENLYRMAYLQGAMDQVQQDRDAMKKRIPA